MIYAYKFTGEGTVGYRTLLSRNEGAEKILIIFDEEYITVSGPLNSAGLFLLVITSSPESRGMRWCVGRHYRKRTTLTPTPHNLSILSVLVSESNVNLLPELATKATITYTD